MSRHWRPGPRSADHSKATAPRAPRRGQSRRRKERGVATVIQLLGRPGIRRPGGRGPRPRGRKTWALLALASLSERPVPRHQLVRMLFPEADDASGALRWVL